MNRELLEEKLKNREQLILQQNEKISALEKEIESMKFDKNNLMMFFEVAAKALKLDPSCDPGKLDPMCTAEAVRGLEEENAAFREGLERIIKADGNIIFTHPPKSQQTEIAKDLLTKYPKKEPRSVMGEQK